MCYMAQFCANEEILSLFLRSSKHSHPPWIIGIRSSACSFYFQITFLHLFQKHLLLLYWLRQSLWLCGSQWTVENSSRDGNTRPPDLLPDKSVFRSTVKTGHGTTDWFQIRKGVRQGCILSPCLLNLYAEYIIWNARLDEAQLELRLTGEISITSDTQMTPHLWQKMKRN